MHLFIHRCIAVLVLGLLVSCAQPGPPPGGPDEPVLNVDPSLHGNIAAAQSLSRQAYDSVTSAQRANDYNLGGHAARAKELLREANEEMKLAALAANRRY
jgi:hypothetical protein